MTVLSPQNPVLGCIFPLFAFLYDSSTKTLNTDCPSIPMGQGPHGDALYSTCCPHLSPIIPFLNFLGFLNPSQTSPKANLHRATRGGFQEGFKPPEARSPNSYYTDKWGPLNILREASGEKIFCQSKQKTARRVHPLRRIFVTNDGKDSADSSCEEFLEVPKYESGAAYALSNR